MAALPLRVPVLGGPVWGAALIFISPNLSGQISVCKHAVDLSEGENQARARSPPLENPVICHATRSSHKNKFGGVLGCSHVPCTLKTRGITRGCLVSQSLTVDNVEGLTPCHPATRIAHNEALASLR